ncbi:MAG: Crp/Fnr family transcriptional regulator [Nitrosomonadales bacterium]|nr:Crp/Fnr family transcriptional regulator [Nitrosomonadales bacterium]
MSHEHYLKQNQLLAALPPTELKKLTPYLELVVLTAGDILCEAGKRPSHTYFPVDSALALYHRMEDGDAAEIVMVGNEGMFSVSHVMGGETLPYFAAIETTGHAFRIDRNLLKQELARSESLWQTLLLYSQAALTQIAQAAVCGRHHSLNQQLCLHLLLVHDKSLTDDFILTHDAIAHMLGVRREGVTASAGKLREDGLIDYKRGHIKVVDRQGLEAQCCECYGVVKQEFKRLLGY